jgi:hypothetical protein
MNVLSWVGIALMAVAVLWSLATFVARHTGGRHSGYWLREVTEVVKASTGFVRAITDLLRVPYGAPALVFVGGLVVLIIGQVTK